MSDVERKDEEETEVESHSKRLGNEEPRDEGDDEVEAHIKKPNLRID
jgi:hypothetical protein